jgi:hypothetical protein
MRVTSVFAMARAWDENRSMSRNADTDLLPWIMGGLMGVVAVAAIVGNAVGTLRPAAAIERAAAPKVTTSLTTSVSMSAAATDGGAKAPATVTSATVTPGTPTLGAVMPLAPVIPPTPIPQSTGSELPAGQVWECVVNGQRTFSDSPCGDHPAIRQLSEVNTMAAVPVGRAPRLLPPDTNYAGVGPEYAPDSYAPEYPEEPATESANGVAYYPLAVVPYRYRVHGPSAAPQPERRGPQNQIRASHPPRAVARSTLTR